MSNQEFLTQLMEGNGVDHDNSKLFTIDEVRHWMNTQILQHGKTDCPCCKAHHQTYKRTISKTLVYWMTALRKLTKDGSKYIHFKTVDQYLYDRLQLNGSDYIILKKWYMIEPFTKVDPETNKETTTGEFTITKLGMDFLDGKIKVPKYLYFSNGKVIKKSKDEITFLDPKNFDINDLTKL